jgi:glucose-1-phosphate adenylyltransferase
MRSTVAIVFAGGRAEEMSVLTFWRPKSAVIFGGAYRMIDFALTNLARTAGINHVGILSQYRPSSLIDHVGIGLPWDFVGNQRGIRFLPPHIGPDHADWYRGTADALYQNIDFLTLHRPDDVLIVSGDHAYCMDYTPLLRFHRERDADVTLAFTPVELNPSRFGIAELNAEGRIMSYMEKPKYPRTNLASMTVYVFKREVLLEELRRHAALTPEGRKTYQIYDEILPHMMQHRRAFGWVHYGPWEYARTLDGYYAAHQDLLGPEPRIDLNTWDVRTNPMMRRAAPPPPTRTYTRAEVVDSLVAGGCQIHGRVENSILSPDVVVGRGAVVRNSILWDKVTVENNAIVDRVIADKRCVIGAGARVGAGDETPPNDEHPASLSSGVTVLGMDVHVPAAMQVGRNVIIYPKAGPEVLAEGPIPSGSTVRMPTR